MIDDDDDDDDDHQPAKVDTVSTASTRSCNSMDGPLLIVLDNDDYGDGSDEDEGIEWLTINDSKKDIEMTNPMSSESRTKVRFDSSISGVDLVLQAINEMGELISPSPKQATVTSSSSSVPVVAPKKLTKQRSLPAKPRRSTLKSSSPSDSILSTVSFDDKSNILAISRMGSTYYCLEDLYLKVFASLCTLEELIDLLARSGTVLLKQVTLSEKIAIEEQVPTLKPSSLARYRLISLSYSDYLNKLKQLLRYHSAETRLDRILKKMQRDKPSSTNVPSKESRRCYLISL